MKSSKKTDAVKAAETHDKHTPDTHAPNTLALDGNDDQQVKAHPQTHPQMQTSANTSQSFELSRDALPAAELQEGAMAPQFQGRQSGLASGVDLRQISHDLNNYLTILMTHCDELRTELSVNEQRQARFALLHDNLRLAASIVNELTSTEDNQTAYFIPFDQFRSFLEEQENVWNLLTGGAMQINLDVSLDSHSSLQIKIIPNYAKRALMQIIRNAAEAIFTDIELDASDEQPLSQPKLDVWLVLSPSDIYLHIQDNGPGISPYLAETLFHPGASTKEGQHRGHGLASAARLIQFWDGKIANLPSETGAHFTVSFPVMQTKT